MPADPKRVETIFNAALALPPSDCAAFLAVECGTDAELRARVERLLAAHSELDAPPPDGAEPATATFNDAAHTEDHTPQPDAGTLIAGKYKLIEEIGEGGMGSVWMAQQTEPVKRMVAVKLIKAGMDSRAVLARFEAERQALAMMDHPNIAKVFDGGVTAEGRPFFVMELVKGVPITEFCDARKLTPRERLELFVPVCQAIQHAHQKGVIHRDIKPNNVLVAMYDDKPVPKVIDFGVSKATGQPLTERTLATGFGAVVGTPEYMSPEQASFNNLDIDTRSDVYALGVLLYELLAGSPPFSRTDLEKIGLLEIFRVIREQEPPRPSTKLSTANALPTLSANRGTEPKRLAALLRGELDWIVMKALEKDRNRRYETANAFAADVQRFLAGEQVQAVPPSVGYRFKKFLKRNKGPVLAAITVLLVLVAGIVGTALGLVEARNQRDTAGENEKRANDNAAVAEARRTDAEKATALAEVRRQDAEKATTEATAAREKVQATFDSATDDFVSTQVFNNALGGGIAALSPNEKQFLERVLKFYESLIPALPPGPDRAEALMRKGAVCARLFDAAGTERAFAGAIETWRAVVARDRSAVVHRERLALAHERFALAWKRFYPQDHKSLPREIEQYRLAAEVRQAVADEFPTPEHYHRAARRWLTLGLIRVGLSLDMWSNPPPPLPAEVDWQETERDIRRGLGALERAVALEPASGEFPRLLRAYADCLLRAMTRNKDLTAERAAELFRDELLVRVRLARVSPEPRMDLGSNLRENVTVGPIRDQGTYYRLVTFTFPAQGAGPDRSEQVRLAALQQVLAREPGYGPGTAFVPALRAGVAVALLRLAPLDPKKRAEAETEFRTALALARDVKESPFLDCTPTDHVYFVWLWGVMGLSMPEVAAAALAEWRVFAEQNGAPPRARVTRLRESLHRYCGDRFVQRAGESGDDLDRATAQFDESARLFAFTAEGFSAQPNYIGEYIAAQARFASVLQSRNRPAEALRAHGRVIDVFDRFVWTENGPALLRTPVELTVALQFLFPAHLARADLFALAGRHEEAVGEYKACVAALERSKQFTGGPQTVVDYVRDDWERQNRIPALFRLGRSLHRIGKQVDAEVQLDAALTALVHRANQNTGNQDDVTALAQLMFDRGMMYSELKDYTRAADWLERAAKQFEGVKTRWPGPGVSNMIRWAHQRRAEVLDQSGRYRDALAELDIAIPLMPPAEQPQAKIDRLRLVALTGDHAEATKAVEEQLMAPGLTNVAPYQAGCVYALSLRHVKGDDQLREKCAKRAVELVKKALDDGYNDAANVRRDTDLDSLRGRADFKALMAELDKKFPPPPVAPQPREVKP